jgi:hypothetical protein
MVAQGLASKIREREVGPTGLDAKVEKELRDIVQRAECGFAIGKAETPSWYYRVPQPGVRYYCYEPGPSHGELPARP